MALDVARSALAVLAVLLGAGCSLDPGSGVGSLSGGAGASPSDPSSGDAPDGSTGAGDGSTGTQETGAPGSTTGSTTGSTSTTTGGDPSTSGDDSDAVDSGGEGSTGEPLDGGSTSGGGDANSCAVTPIEGTGPWLAFGETSGVSLRGGSCGGDAAPEMIHAWTPSVSGTYLIGVEGADFDTVAYVLEGSCEGMELACNDQVGMPNVAQLEITVSAGQTYLVVVDGNDNQSGGYILYID